MTTRKDHAALDARLQLARSAIMQAGAVAHNYFEHFHTLAVEQKTSGQDIVSEADRAVERGIRDAVRAAFPEDGLWGEELGRQAGRSDFTWVIDPIDGTAPFLHGLPSWTVVIALLSGGETVAGFILSPCEGDLYSAVAGGGAFRNGQPIRVDGRNRLDSGLVTIGPGGPRFADHVGGIVTRLLRAGGLYMHFGSAARSLALVASGRTLAFYEPALSAWDCLAGLLLVREAGGRTEGFDPGPDWQRSWEGRLPVLAVAPQAEAALRAIIGPLGGAG